MMAFTCTSFSDHVGTSIASAGRTPNGGANSGSAAAARLAGAGQRRRALCEMGVRRDLLDSRRLFW